MWGMNKIGPYAGVFLAMFVVGMFFGTMYLTSLIGGWRRLARRFRAQEPFYGEQWGWQSAQLRGWCNYNHCVTVGASAEALYLALNFPFGLFHPPLLIPWKEIEVETGKVWFGWYDTAKFRVGVEERIGLRIYGALVNRVRQSAGPGWPLYRIEEMERSLSGDHSGREA
jgi:hypothetical protein